MSSIGTDVGTEVAEVICNSATSAENRTKKWNNQKIRAFIFTLWPETNGNELLKWLRNQEPTYICWAPEECPETKKPHFQGYVYFKNPRSPSALKSKFKGHWIQPANGQAIQSKRYCQGPWEGTDHRTGLYKVKPLNHDFVEEGELPSQGQRVDIYAFHKAIQSGRRGRDLSVDHLEARAKYPRLEATLIMEEDEARAQQLYRDGFCNEVHVRWGKPGVGKTKSVFDQHGCENIYEANFGDGSSKSLWWDGYKGQEVILINEFTGIQMGWEYFLKFLDRYPFRMQVKGGHVWKLAKYIYITSNYEPRSWYPAHIEHYEALERRLTSVTEVV